MSQEAKTLLNRISLDGVIENSQHTKETAYTKRRNQLAANPAHLLNLSFTDLRDANSHGENDCVEDVRMKSSKRLPKAKIFDVVQVAKEVEKCVSEAGSGKGRSEQTPPSALFEIAHEGGIEEAIDQ